MPGRESAPLEEYRRKRDFARTPEPGGSPVGVGLTTAAAPAVGGRYVVQRHRATRLHYDLRLEIAGVLVSWAVPRGPTLDPAEKRMAVHVEDHPMEYLDFEGVIPSRQYGAGDVIVWDWGTWTPEETTDPRAAVATGELKFRLQGEKLRGRYTIVRTSGRGRGGPRAFEEDGQEQWLLIKKKDETAAIGWDAEDHPRSVKTGRTNDEVKANRDALWISGAPAPVAQIDLAAARPAGAPSFIAPMLATLTAKPFDSPDWLFEVKWDGFRTQAIVADRTVRLYTRNGNDAASYFGRVLEPPSWIDAHEAIVDGEMVALDQAGRPDFSLLQERLGVKAGGEQPDVVFVAFDLLQHDGRSLLDVPLEDRKRLLRAVLHEGRRVRYASHVEADGIAFHAAAKSQGLEGIVAKQRHSRYEPGKRTNHWLKIKLRPEQELVVGGWTPAEGSTSELGALVVGVYEDRTLHFAGKVGSGFNAAARRQLRPLLETLAVDDPPFDPPPPKDYRGRWGGDLRGVTWLRPELVIRAEIGGWSRDGIVRQSAYKGIEPGREPRSVVREIAAAAPPDPESVARAGRSGPRPETEPGRRTYEGPNDPFARRFGPDGQPWAATEDELAALERIGREGIWRVGGQELKLTNLDKVLFPPGADKSADAQPITKRDLIGYFALISPVVLPHLADRPLNLNRFPDGVGGDGFWQKDLRKTDPTWLRRWREIGVDRRDANEHLVADRVATMCWLGNQAAFEFHAWTSRLTDPLHPTFALIDIDPGEATTWDETLTLARLFRTALGHLGVRGYPKLTGKRGIQVWIPIVPRYDFAETSAWIEQISRAVGAIVPDLVSWEWAKDARKGRARLDYTQNAFIKTLVAPYAVRPQPGAPVSAPIGWDELDDPSLTADRWTIRTIVDRVRAVGDLFAAAQTDLQELPPLG
ncbi:MAG TPA: DNA ligase D [Candidatus Limnocylindrales bacterium]|nr:DNA ligase D [Candidatus Limnocylindrales bacterium]